MTKQEIAIVENEDKMHITNIICPTCYKIIHEHQFVNHFSFEHNDDVSDFDWKVSKPQIKISNDDIVVQFPIVGDKKPNRNKLRLKDVIQSYYDGLFYQYKTLNQEHQIVQLKPIAETELNKSLVDEIDAKNLEEQNMQFANSKLVNLVWDNLVFEKNIIKFQHKDHFISPVVCDGIMPQLNDIKNSYFNKEHKILLKFLVTKGQIDKENSPGWKKLLEIIDLAKVKLDENIKSIANKAYSIPDVSGLTNTQIIEKFTPRNGKSFFIKFLASEHSSLYPIIPIIENRNSIQEVSFVFTLISGEFLFLIWENCSENRGTHIFKIEKSDYKKSIKSLKSYIQDPDIFNKRKTLWQNDKASLKVKKLLNHFSSLRHTDVNSFKKDFNSFIK